MTTFVQPDAFQSNAFQVDGQLPAGTHSSTGALTAQSAVVGGTAARTKLHTTSGALTAGSAVVAGVAVRNILKRYNLDLALTYYISQRARNITLFEISDIFGTGANTVAAFTQVGTGEVPIEGTGANTLDTFTQVGTGLSTDQYNYVLAGVWTSAQRIRQLVLNLQDLSTGTGANTLDDFTQVGEGFYGQPERLGTGANTVDNFTQVCNGAVGYNERVGTGANTVEDFIQYASNAIPITGSGANTLTSFTQVATGDSSGWILGNEALIGEWSPQVRMRWEMIVSPSISDWEVPTPEDAIWHDPDEPDEETWSETTENEVVWTDP